MCASSGHVGALAAHVLGAALGRAAQRPQRAGAVVPVDVAPARAPAGGAAVDEPPVTEQPPLAVLVRRRRARRDRRRGRGRGPPIRRVPSNALQPRFFGGSSSSSSTRSISSTSSWPTSPIQTSPSAGSNQKRHGLRSPVSTTFQLGIEASTSTAISLPSRFSGSCAVRARVERAAAVAEARGRGGRRARTRAGRRCGSPPAGRPSAAGAAAAARSCGRARRGTRRRACRRCGSDQCRNSRPLVAKSGWKAIPSSPCSAPVRTWPEMSSSVDRRPPSSRITRPGCSSTHSAPGSPGAAPTQTGRLSPLAMRSTSKLCARAAPRSRAPALELVELVAAARAGEHGGGQDGEAQARRIGAAC